MGIDARGGLESRALARAETPLELELSPPFVVGIRPTPCPALIPGPTIYSSLPLRLRGHSPALPPSFALPHLSVSPATILRPSHLPANQYALPEAMESVRVGVRVRHLTLATLKRGEGYVGAGGQAGRQAGVEASPLGRRFLGRKT